MKIRTIIVRFEIEDNDLVEQKLFNSLQCDSFKDFQKLPDTKELFENDDNFRKIYKHYKDAKKQYKEYIFNKKNIV